MKKYQIMLLQERFNHLNADGKAYLLKALGELPTYQRNLRDVLFKISIYSIMIIIINSLFQFHFEIKFILSLVFTFIFFIEVMIAMAKWDSWSNVHKELKKPKPNLSLLVQYSIDSPANIIKILLTSIMASVTFSSVMTFIDYGIFYIIPAASVLIAISHYFGTQSEIKMRFLMFVSTDIGRYKEDRPSLESK